MSTLRSAITLVIWFLACYVLAYVGLVFLTILGM